MFDKCDCLFDKSKQALIMSQRPIMAPLRKSTLSAILPPSFPDEMGKNEAKTPFFGIRVSNLMYPGKRKMKILTPPLPLPYKGLLFIHIF